MSNTKKSTKSIWLIIILFSVFILGYYLSLTSKKTPGSKGSEINTGGMDIDTKDITKGNRYLIYLDSGENYTDIYKVDIVSKKPLKVFTDKDEQEKIKSAQSMTSDGRKILAQMAPKEQEFVGTLYFLALDGSGDKQKLQDNFASTQPPLVSPDGNKIAYTLFSNAEADFGFKLIISNIDGSSKREIANDQTSLVILSWNTNSDKIAYTKGSTNDQILATVDSNNLETKELGKPTKKINHLYWGGDNQFVLSQTNESNLNQTEIYAFSDNFKSIMQITRDEQFDDFPVLSYDNYYLAYYKTRYDESEPTFNKSGDIYYSQFNGDDLIKIASGTSIIGWAK